MFNVGLDQAVSLAKSEVLDDPNWSHAFVDASGLRLMLHDLGVVRPWLFEEHGGDFNGRWQEDCQSRYRWYVKLAVSPGPMHRTMYAINWLLGTEFDEGDPGKGLLVYVDTETGKVVRGGTVSYWW